MPPRKRKAAAIVLKWAPKPSLRLPQELLVAILKNPGLGMQPQLTFMSPNRLFRENCEGNGVFLVLRRVDRNMKSTVEKLYPTALEFMNDRIIEGFILSPSTARATELSRLPRVATLSHYTNPTDNSALAQRAPKQIFADAINLLLSVCIHLQSLRWTFHASSVIDVRRLDFARSGSLRTLSLDFRGQADIRELDMGRMERLTQLDVRGPWIGLGRPLGGPTTLPVGLTKLALCHLTLPLASIKAIRSLRSLRELDLSNSPLTVKQCQKLAPSKQPTLVKLDLSSTQVDDASVRALRLKGSSVKELDLTGNLISNPLCLQLDGNATLEQLSIGRNQLTSLDFRLHKCTSLRSLSVSFCSRLAHLLQSPPPQGVSFPAQLRQSTSLRHLNITGCSFNDAKIATLRIEENSHLQIIDLGYDDLTDSDLLNSGLASHPSLKSIRLYWNTGFATRASPSERIIKALTTNTCQVEYNLDGRILQP